LFRTNSYAAAATKLSLTATPKKKNNTHHQTSEKEFLLFVAVLYNSFIYWSFVFRVCKTVHPTLSHRCLSCNVGVLWPNDQMDEDATWYGDGPHPMPQCVRWGPSSPSRKRAQQPPPNFSTHFALARLPISATAELLCA